ncbi:MAG: glycosyltransferase family 4 protein [Chloroflexi bacterium]|nr:glycosyltransferase family 4 protein [Chloroflexota bacterium]
MTVPVLFVQPVSDLAGAEFSLRQLVLHLRAPYRPIVALPDGPLRDLLEREGVTTERLPFTSRWHYFVKTYRPDRLVASGLGVAAMTARVVALARKHQAQILHANTVLAAPYVAAAALTLRRPYVLHLRDYTIPRLPRRLFNWAARSSHCTTIFISHALRRHFMTAEWPYRHVVIPNCIDTDRFAAAADGTAFRREHGLAPDDLVVGVAGRVERWKGFDTFVSAVGALADRFPRLRAVVVGDVFAGGDPTARQLLLDQVRALGLEERVRFTGFRSDIASALASLDVFVHCPREPEPFGRVAIEAMACARPVVAANHGGLVEIVRPGETGMLVRPDDPTALAGALATLLENPALRERLGGQGLAVVRDQFSPERHVAAVSAVYSDLLNRDCSAPQSLESSTCHPSFSSGGRQ